MSCPLGEDAIELKTSCSQQGDTVRLRERDETRPLPLFPVSWPSGKWPLEYGSTSWRDPEVGGAIRYKEGEPDESVAQNKALCILNSATMKTGILFAVLATPAVLANTALFYDGQYSSASCTLSLSLRSLSRIWLVS